MSAVDHPSGIPLNEQSSNISYSSLFGFLTGVLLLLAFCFSPWLSSSVDCGGLCDGVAQLQPANPTGLALAAGGVTTHALAVRFNAATPDQPNVVSLHTPSLPASQFGLPLLWILPIVSLLMMLIPLRNLLSGGSRSLQGDIILGLVFFIAVFVEVFYFVSTFSAFSVAKNAIAQASIQAPDGGMVSSLTLYTFPGIGLWFALLITLLGGALILWVRWEERPTNLAPIHFLGHLESVTRLGNVRRLTYSLNPLSVTRPLRGTSKTPLICPRCRSAFTLRVASKQTLWLYRSLLAVGLIAFALLAIFLFEQTVVVLNSGNGPDPFLSFLCMLAALFCLIFLIALEDGIGLGRPFDRSHRIRRGKRPADERPSSL